MQIGIIGLGKMGGNMARGLARQDHQCVVFDQNAAAVKALVDERMTGGADLKQLVAQLEKPRAVWVMLPAGEITDKTVTQLGALLERGDIIVDGGNSFYQDDEGKEPIDPNQKPKEPQGGSATPHAAE